MEKLLMVEHIGNYHNPQLMVEIENEIAISDGNVSDHLFHPIRRLTTQYITETCGLDSHTIDSLPDAIEAAIGCEENTARRTVALLVTRMAGTRGLLPMQDASSRVQRNVVQLFEKALPDFCKRLKLSQETQTYEKFRLISELHEQICVDLSLLTRLSSDPRILIANKQDVLKLINNERNSSYLIPYNIGEIKAAVTHILKALPEAAEVNDLSFGEKILNLEQFVDAERSRVDAKTSFLNKKYYVPFLKTVKECINKIEADAKDKFVCNLTTKRSGKDIADKHYPLHEPARIINVTVMLINTGPGKAIDVLVDFSSNSEDIEFDHHLSIGDVAPGDFPLSFEVMPSRNSSRADMQVMLSWLEIGNPNRRTYAFELSLVGQNPHVDWKNLAKLQPYNTEVAEGDEFVGRQSKVQALTSRFQMKRMGSSFITGQKRVGKTSLAREVENRLTKEVEGNFKILYLEYGQYSRMDPIKTVEALGNEIADFLMSYIPPSDRQQTQYDFHGSLADLNKLADRLIKVAPEAKFILILDEFDEIYPEMYRYGALAETFFSNIRTLSAKKNMAFLLVGGEKMPFVMSAQGDQLNKFISEGLDYFVRGEEWDDYKELVSRPVNGQLNWAVAAINRVFDLTNGHPYYTKLLCAKVFSNAVRESDSEINDSDVKYCAKKLVAEMDSNAFAHLWKDGISEERVRAEVLELNRRRVLSACARALRAKLPICRENIIRSKAALNISDAEIPPILNDFVRRGILIEHEDRQQLDFSIPIFAAWLEEVGISKLMSDSLSEEYESVEQRAEEQARVASAEIVSLVESWQLYRGKEIGSDDIRAWLEQVPLNREQRLLFKLLKNLRFVSKIEIRKALEEAHTVLRDCLPEFVQVKRADRRKDILVTWVDGPGKSGNTYASLYIEDNKISGKCLTAPDVFSEVLRDYEEKEGSSVTAVVIVDDFIGTGDSLSKNLTSFVEGNATYFNERKVRLLAIAVTATTKGAQKVRAKIEQLGIDGSLHICEPLLDRYFAFGDGLGFWESFEEKGRAKELCQRLGGRIHRVNSLGYGDQGLLLTFPETCPNNSLPILHGDAAGQEPWRSLFPRPKN